MEYLLLAIVIGFIGCLAATWWNTPDDHTFKRVIQDLLRDIVEICEPATESAWCLAKRVWAFVGPRLTNLPTVAVVLLDVYATATPEMRDLIGSDHRAAAILLLLNLFARLSPRDAPAKIPPPANGGLVNDHSLRTAGA